MTLTAIEKDQQAAVQAELDTAREELRAASEFADEAEVDKYTASVGSPEWYARNARIAELASKVERLQGEATRLAWKEWME